MAFPKDFSVLKYRLNRVKQELNLEHVWLTLYPDGSGSINSQNKHNDEDYKRVLLHWNPNENYFNIIRGFVDGLEEGKREDI